MSLSASGCDFLKQSQGHLLVKSAHHGEPRAGLFPELTGQSGAREFKSDGGWNIVLVEGIINATKIELQACPDDMEEEDSSESDEGESDSKKKKSKKKKKPVKEKDDSSEEDSSSDEENSSEEGDSSDEIRGDGDKDEDEEAEVELEWIEIPMETDVPEMLSSQKDIMGSDLAEHGALNADKYCKLRVTFSKFKKPKGDKSPTDDKGNEIPSAIFGETAYVAGLARKSKKSDAKRFRVAIDDTIKVVVDIPGTSDSPLTVPNSRQPVSLTISKVYDRFFDGVDFSKSNYEKQIAASLAKALRKETYVTIGSRPGLNYLKKEHKDKE